jgi:hypothetical protein
MRNRGGSISHPCGTRHFPHGKCVFAGNHSLSPEPAMYTHENADIKFDHDAEYDQLVDVGLIIPEEEILRMTPPCHDEFKDDAEFFRWREYGGKARPHPLDFDELVAFMVNEYGYDMANAVEKVARESHARRGDKDLWRRLLDRSSMVPLRQLRTL